MNTLSHAAHTVAFFQTAFTIVLALALGQALGQFVSDEDHRPLHWDRLPLFVTFILIIFPFFQGMGRFMSSTISIPRPRRPTGRHG